MTFLRVLLGVDMSFDFLCKTLTL